MINLSEIVENVHLLKVPFESVYTSVFFVIEGKEITMYDTATTKDDTENYIFPALSELEKQGFKLERVVVSHFHGDHAGGLRYVADKYPEAKIYSGGCDYFNNNGFCGVINVCDGEKITQSITLYRFEGHSHDCVGIYDERTSTLLTADAFQGYGILRYGVCGNVKKWFESISKAKKLCAQNLITSHEYFPLGQTAFGKEKVVQYLDNCGECFEHMYEYIKKCALQGVTDMNEAAKRFNAEKKAEFSRFPTIGKDCMENVKAYFEGIE